MSRPSHCRRIDLRTREPDERLRWGEGGVLYYSVNGVQMQALDGPALPGLGLRLPR